MKRCKSCGATPGDLLLVLKRHLVRGEKYINWPDRKEPHLVTWIDEIEEWNCTACAVMLFTGKPG